MGIGSILLAAGEGKRLRPLTNALAKPAIPLLDVPLGAFGLASIVEKAPPVVVNASHRAASLEAALEAVCPTGWSLFDEGSEPYGTAGTIAALADQVDGPLIVYNGDLLADVDPALVLAAHASSEAGITVVVRLVERGADVTIVNDVVTEFIDRRRERTARGGQYLGIAVINAADVRSIPTERPLGLGESVLAPVAREGRLRVYPHDGYALDVGTIERYLKASDDCLYGIAPAPPVPFPGRIVEVEGGNAYLGPGVVATRTSLGAGAIVLKNSYVDPGARIERSVVWPDELVPEGELVRDSIWIGGRPTSI